MVLLVRSVNNTTKFQFLLELRNIGYGAKFRIIARAERDGTRAETRFRLPRNGRLHLNRWGLQFSRLLAAEVCASA